MKPNGRFKPGVSGNQTAKWKPGQSGNPAGKSHQRLRFEETFNESLITQGGPEEAAQLLWESARAKEPWAIQELCRRFAPEARSLRLVHEVDHDDGIDYSKLTDDQIQQLEAILGSADDQPAPLEGGEGPTASI
jgi:hypothetical protein